MKINIIVEKTKDGYSGYTEKYPVCSIGKTIIELKKNLKDAIRLYFDEKDIIISKIEFNERCIKK